MSLSLIARARIPTRAAVIDIGGGTSRLLDQLLDRGFSDLTLLDISAGALAEAQQRLGHRASSVHFVRADITEATLGRTHDLWHDRAVFHFLTDPADRRAYRSLMERTVTQRGWVMIATFAADGPAQCSGLPVVQYTPESLSQELGSRWSLVSTEEEEHRTPKGRRQSFVYCMFRRSSQTTRSDIP